MASKRPAMESLKDSPKIKRNKYEQSYLVKYSKIPGIKPSKLGPKYARCDYCKCDVSISHAGVYDINRHREKIKHKENETAVNNHTLTNYFGKDDPSSNFKLSVVNAEAMMSKLTCNWNLPLTAADAFTSVFKKAFPGMFIT